MRARPRAWVRAWVRACVRASSGVSHAARPHLCVPFYMPCVCALPVHVRACVRARALPVQAPACATGAVQLYATHVYTQMHSRMFSSGLVCACSAAKGRNDLYIDSLSASQTVCPSRRYGRAGTQNERPGESLPTVPSTRAHAESTRAGACAQGYSRASSSSLGLQRGPETGVPTNDHRPTTGKQ